MEHISYDIGIAPNAGEEKNQVAVTLVVHTQSVRAGSVAYEFAASNGWKVRSVNTVDIDKAEKAICILGAFGTAILATGFSAPTICNRGAEFYDTLEEAQEAKAQIIEAIKEWSEKWFEAPAEWAIIEHVEL